MMKELAIATLVTGSVCTATATGESLPLAQEWDKTFPKSDKVEHAKATFKNRFGITLAADVYKPKVGNGEWGTGNGRADASRPPKFAAIAVSGPFGAVKEQSSGLYAQTLAERGFLTIAFDPSFTGESGGTPRYDLRMGRSRHQRGSGRYPRQGDGGLDDVRHDARDGERLLRQGGQRGGAYGEEGGDERPADQRLQIWHLRAWWRRS